VIELDFICDLCGLPVEDGAGALYVAHADVAAARTSMAPSDADGRLDVIAFLGQPVPALWHIHHDVCRAPDADGYDIAVELVRRWRDLAHWTAQLMEKSWLPATNWRVVLGDAADGRTRRIVPVRVHGDAA
jgi:hypothetical protein